MEESCAADTELCAIKSFVHGKRVTIIVAPAFWTALKTMAALTSLPAEEEPGDRCTAAKFLGELLECALIDCYQERFGDRIAGEVAVDPSAFSDDAVDDGARSRQRALNALYMRHKRMFGATWNGKGFFPHGRCSDLSCELCGEDILELDKILETATIA